MVHHNNGTGSADLWLEIGAKFSVLASVLVIIYFFVATTYRIARLPNGIWPFFYVHRRQELHQTPTPLPFTFQLVDSSTKEVNKFTFRLSMIRSEQDKPETIQCLWGVDARYLFGLVRSASWENVEEPMDEDKVMIVDTIRVERKIESEDEVKVTVTAPARMEWNKLNGQYKYPLAIFLSLKQGRPENLSPTAIVGICVVLHVKHELIPRNTAILAQYIKLANGQSHKLQPLYVEDVGEVEVEEQLVSSPSSADNEAATSTQQPFSSVMCSACQTFPVSRAIVPCGHVCLCANCFGKVVNCPMCRGPITYFFKTRNESYLHEHDHQD